MSVYHEIVDVSIRWTSAFDKYQRRVNSRDRDLCWPLPERFVSGRDAYFGCRRIGFDLVKPQRRKR